MPENNKRQKVIAMVTGTASILIGLVYLLIVIALDFRGSMIPPPPEAFGVEVVVSSAFFSKVQQPFLKQF